MFARVPESTKGVAGSPLPVKITPTLFTKDNVPVPTVNVTRILLIVPASISVTNSGLPFA